MKTRTLPSQLAAGVIVLVPMLLIGMIAASLSGIADVSWGDLLDGDRFARIVFLEIRLPRILLAMLVGGTLAIAGSTFQVLLRNPLADPFVLGVSGGAAAAAAIATLLGASQIPGLVSLSAFAGACAATAMVFTLGRSARTFDSARLILSGLVLNSFFSAVILLSLSMSRGSDLTAALRWMMGSFASAGWREVALLSVMASAAVVALLSISGDLRMLAFGEDDARARGVDTDRIRMIGFFAASMATGAAVSVSGIIGFIGLLVPHAVRLIWHSDYRIVLPLSALGGALLMLAADTVARTLSAPAELPIGALTALLGVPLFLSLMRRS